MRAPNWLEPRIQVGTRRPPPRNGLHRLSRLDRLEVVQQLAHVLRELVGTVEIAAQCTCGRLIGTRRTAQAKVDAVRIQRGQRSELLGHLQRGMIGQHDAARADTDAPGATGNMADQHGGGGTGDAGHVVVFGQPVAAVAQRIGMLGQFQHVGEGGGGVTALADRGQVKDRQRDHQALFRHRITSAWGRPGAAASDGGGTLIPVGRLQDPLRLVR